MANLQMIKYFFHKIIHIIKGTFFNLFRLKQDLAKTRLSICNQCKHKVKTSLGYVCDQCGCILESKTRVEDEHCDLDKW